MTVAFAWCEIVNTRYKTSPLCAPGEQTLNPSRLFLSLWTFFSSSCLLSLVARRIFPDLSSTEMVVVIVKGMNLPAPSGNNIYKSFYTAQQVRQQEVNVCSCLMLCDQHLLLPVGIQTNDLDAYIRFDFPYPSTVRRPASPLQSCRRLATLFFITDGCFFLKV